MWRIKNLGKYKPNNDNKKIEEIIDKTKKVIIIYFSKTP